MENTIMREFYSRNPYQLIKDYLHSRSNGYDIKLYSELMSIFESSSMQSLNNYVEMISADLFAMHRNERQENRVKKAVGYGEILYYLTNAKNVSRVNFDYYKNLFPTYQLKEYVDRCSLICQAYENGDEDFDFDTAYEEVSRMQKILTPNYTKRRCPNETARKDEAKISSRMIEYAKRQKELSRLKTRVLSPSTTEVGEIINDWEIKLAEEDLKRRAIEIEVFDNYVKTGEFSCPTLDNYSDKIFEI